MTTCPFCAEDVKEGAVGCPHCGHRLDENQRRSMRQAWAVMVVLLAIIAVVAVSMYKANHHAAKNQTDQMACQVEKQTGGPTPDCHKP